MVTPVSDQVGRVLGDRYRLIAPLGTGASSQVFLADDTTLRRRVAVKMLHPTLADDEVFLKRFRSEAQAAGALNHPNVMSVYDWGHDGVPYLVCEYLSGGTLRAVLDAGHLLTPSQALVVGLDAVRGLDFAHRRGLVHRDIKPGNLIFDEERRLRIADFGLARALAEAGWTEPHGTVVGTARYASPEQAQGQSLTGKSDVYALALVLVEVVTGTVPFGADTTLGTLMARVDQPLPVSDELGPLRQSIERAGAPDPEDRPDAGEFGVALMAAAEELPRPKPIPTVDTMAVGAGVMVDRDPTMMAPSPTDDDAAIDGPVPDDAEPAAALTPEGPRAVVGGADDGPPPRRALWALVFAALLAAVGVGGWFAYQATVTQSHDVPEMAGMTEDQALGLVADNNWVLDPKLDRSDDVAEGEVVRTEPVAGTSLAEGEIIEIWFSRGPTTVSLTALDDISGITPEELERRLVAVELVLGEGVPTPHETIEEGLVIGFDEGKTDIPKGEAVRYLVSAGPEPRLLPDSVSGLTCDDATALLQDLRLEVRCRTEFSDTVVEGEVTRLDPAGGTEVAVGITVTVWVSEGREPIEVPTVIGDSVDEAESAIEEVGLSVCDGVDGPPNGVVIGQDPIGGELAQPGECVELSSRGDD
ncbi:MAG: protein kinase domain-containing protein [Acidimicrobiales bacterium]